MSDTSPQHYSVFITPLESENVYGTAVDVSDFIDLRDIGSIKSSVDSDDFDFGLYNYDNITIKADNQNGKFTEGDSRSIFPFKRDTAKVQIKWFDNQGNVSVSFNGLINEESTRVFFVTNLIKFKVLALDSVIRNSVVTSGQITDGTTFERAIESILNTPRITSVLTFDATKINVELDLSIDDGSVFDNKNTRVALNELLLASNSVMVVDQDTLAMVIRARDDNPGIGQEFFGPSDLQGRENISSIRNYNTGFHRAFNSITVNGSNAKDADLIAQFGARLKEITLDFITDSVKALQIANNLLDNFKVPKTEMEILVKNDDAKNLNFFDLILIDYPYRTTPADGADLPVYGIAKYGDAKYPNIHGAIKISPLLAFKIIAKREFPKDFMTSLKLRLRGKTLSDGLLTDSGAYYGFAIYGESKYTEDKDYEPANTPIYGAGRYGEAKYGS